MSKRSNRGKAYFYAMGQRDSIADCMVMNTSKHKKRRLSLPKWAFWAWVNGFEGYYF